MTNINLKDTLIKTIKSDFLNFSSDEPLLLSEISKVSNTFGLLFSNDILKITLEGEYSAELIGDVLNITKL